MKKSILINKDFRNLTCAQIISTFGDSLYLAAILWLATEYTDSSIAISYISVFDMLPAIVLGLFVGTVVDRFPATKMMALSDFARALCALTIFVAYLFGILDIYVIFVVTLIMAIFQAFYNPAHFSAIPQIVANSDIQKGNSISSLAQNISMTVANSAVGILWKTFGASFSFLFDTISFVISGVCELTIPTKSMKDSDVKYKKGKVSSFLKESVDGVRYMLKKPAIISAMVVGIATNATCGTIILLPLLIKKEFSGTITLYGLAEAMGTLGMMLGSYVLMKFQIKNNHRTLILSGILLTVSFGIMAMAPNSIVLLLGRFLYGFFNMVGNIVFSTHFQINIEEQFRGRMYSISYMVSSLSLPIMSLLGGYMADRLGIRMAWIIICIPVLICFVINYIICSKSNWFTVKKA